MHNSHEQTAPTSSRKEQAKVSLAKVRAKARDDLLKHVCVAERKGTGKHRKAQEGRLQLKKARHPQPAERSVI